jgi:hypothetical protein
MLVGTGPPPSPSLHRIGFPVPVVSLGHVQTLLAVYQSSVFNGGTRRCLVLVRAKCHNLKNLQGLRFGGWDALQSCVCVGCLAIVRVDGMPCNHACGWAGWLRHALVFWCSETVNAVRARASACVAELDAAHSGTTICLVAHGDTLQILQTAFLSMLPTEHRSVAHLENCELRWMPARYLFSSLFFLPSLASFHLPYRSHQA